MEMTPDQWRAMIDLETPRIFHTPPECQGQTLEYSYARCNNLIFECIEDHSDGTGTVTIKVYADAGAPYDPEERRPSLGELLWTEVRG